MGYKINDIVKAKVTGVEPYGAFVVLEDKSVGLLHISEISYDFVVDINNYVKVDDIINLKIIDIVDDKIRLSLKALNKRSNRSRRKVSLNKDLNFKIGFKSLENQLKIWIDELKEQYND